jgi:hypothetical protein
VEETVPVFQIVVPIVAAIVGACIALSSVPLNQWLNRRATRDQWLREKRARVYADLVDSVDNLVSVVFLLANALIDHQIVDGDDMQRYNVASANFRRACSVTDLYAPQEIRDWCTRRMLSMCLP